MTEAVIAVCMVTQSNRKVLEWDAKARHTALMALKLGWVMQHAFSSVFDILGTCRDERRDVPALVISHHVMPSCPEITSSEAALYVPR